MNQTQKYLLAQTIKAAMDNGDIEFTINGQPIALSGWGFNRYADHGKSDSLNGHDGPFVFDLGVSHKNLSELCNSSATKNTDEEAST